MDYNEFHYDDATFDMVCFIDTFYEVELYP